ncbi:MULTISPECIES: hypothetical protein [unclassified Lysobacter]|uniref:hypothetical protein n=1 Tax=unclassified Lysobacter TaxID=2635362 RepID=UPI001F58B34F|nr:MULTISPECIES: hypothetical protein [unclassified Lysobacter]
MPEFPSPFELDLVRTCVTHLPRYHSLIDGLRVISREHNGSGYLVRFACAENAEECSFTMDDDVEVGTGTWLDVELWITENEIRKLRIWNPRGPWNGDVSAGYRIHEA